ELRLGSNKDKYNLKTIFGRQEAGDVDDSDHKKVMMIMMITMMTGRMRASLMSKITRRQYDGRA
ncbi:hypothetical protein RJ641_025688, partial [Dillenia turbinata]